MPPRQGFAKVRTGCFTCKTRKVKCDETKPKCNRCVRADRICKGYPDADSAPRAYTWDELLRPRKGAESTSFSPPKSSNSSSWPDSSSDAFTYLSGPPNGLALIPNLDRNMRHSMSFFSTVVVPSVSGFHDKTLWDYVVPQVAHHVPAIRHAVAAICGAFEALASHHRKTRSIDVNDNNIMATGQVRAGGRTARPAELLATPHGVAALKSYNTALRELASKPHNIQVMILAAILFFTFDAMVKDRQGAVNHARHCVIMFNTAVNPTAPAAATATSATSAVYNPHSSAATRWLCGYLSPVITRICVFPFFFGAAIKGFPALTHLTSTVTLPFADIHEAALSADSIIAQTISFLARFNIYKLSATVDDAAVARQATFLKSLNLWIVGFEDASRADEDNYELQLQWRELLMRVLVTRIWLTAVLDCTASTELPFDKHMSDFEVITAEAEAIIADMDKSSESDSPDWEAPDPTASRPLNKTFVFEARFTPVLYFVVIRCRSLSLRLRALRALLRIGTTHEHVWDTIFMAAVGRRIIEVEHGIDFIKSTPLEMQAKLAQAVLPPDSERVRDTLIEDTEIVLPKKDGDSGPSVGVARRGNFMMDHGAGIRKVPEWVVLRDVEMALSDLWRVDCGGDAANWGGMLVHRPVPRGVEQELVV